MYGLNNFRYRLVALMAMAVCSCMEVALADQLGAVAGSVDLPATDASLRGSTPIANASAAAINLSHGRETAGGACENGAAQAKRCTADSRSGSTGEAEGSRPALG
jgi:hypothetical protein